MDLRRDSRTLLTCILAFALVGVLLLAAPTAFAEPSAGDEYALQLPGVNDSINGTRADAAADAQPVRDRVQDGVAGESMPTRSPLASATSLVGGPLIIAIALIGLGLVMFGPRQLRIARAR